MGKAQSTLARNGYTVEEAEMEPGRPFGATKGDDRFLIKILMNPINTGKNPEIEILNINHPHIVSSKNSFTDDSTDTRYVVTDYCQGGNLAAWIRGQNPAPPEDEVVGLILEICMALRTIHEKGLVLKDLTPEDIHLTEYGIVCLSGYQKIYENSKNKQPTTKTTGTSYLAPEFYRNGTYDAKSDIWAVGCILYELCTREAAFSAESTIKLMPKILIDPYPALPEQFSPELRELLIDIFNRDPQLRPTTTEILGCPIIINCLIQKTKTTVEKLQTKVNMLRTLADDLERVHQGATIGSLTGGVIGAVGGITSIVGLILAPFTLGVSLIVTGVGVGVGAVGGVAAGASNIKNMVNQSSDRKAIRSIIKEIEHTINAVVTWLQEISNSLQTLRSRCDTPEDQTLNNDNLLRLGLRAGKGLSGVAELIRLVQVMNIGRIAAQAARAVRVAEVATGVLSGLFVAVDLFFIAMDAKELHHIRQGERQGKRQGGRQGETRSEIMRFVYSTRQAADNLQNVLDELKTIISSITSLGNERQ